MDFVAKALDTLENTYSANEQAALSELERAVHLNGTPNERRLASLLVDAFERAEQAEQAEREMGQSLDSSEAYAAELREQIEQLKRELIDVVSMQEAVL